MTNFTQHLDAICDTNQTLLCVGLDPDPTLLPIKDVAEFNKAIVDATHDLVCAYKPNIAFYEALGLPGLEALQKTVQHIRDVNPSIIILIDAKRGDIGNTSAAYARALFEVWDFDAATVSPYLGSDGLEPFLEYQNKGVFILCRTSNPGAKDFQDLVVVPNESRENARPLYEMVAISALEWNKSGNVGLVLGATYPEELKAVRDICPDLPFLIPGVGSQGGQLEQAVQFGVNALGRRALINSSRGVIYASKGVDFQEAARSAASNLRDSINNALRLEGLP